MSDPIMNVCLRLTQRSSTFQVQPTGGTGGRYYFHVWTTQDGEPQVLSGVDQITVAYGNARIKVFTSDPGAPVADFTAPTFVAKGYEFLLSPDGNAVTTGGEGNPWPPA